MCADNEEEDFRRGHSEGRDINCDLDLHSFRTGEILLQTRKLVSSLPASPIAARFAHVPLDLE